MERLDFIPAYLYEEYMVALDRRVIDVTWRPVVHVEYLEDDAINVITDYSPWGPLSSTVMRGVPVYHQPKQVKHVRFNVPRRLRTPTSLVTERMNNNF